MTDENDALAGEGEPIDGTQEAAAGENAPSWGYEEKKRRFSKEIVIAFLAITMLLSVFSVVVWKSFFNKKPQLTPDAAIASDPNKVDPFATPSSTEAQPTVEPALVSTQTVESQATEFGQAGDPTATTLEQPAMPDPFAAKSEPVANKPTGLFEPDSNVVSSEPFPASSTATKTESAESLFGQQTEPEPAQSFEPRVAKSEPAFETKSEPVESLQPQTVMQERSPTETTFVTEPEPAVSDFRPPRPIASAVQPEPIRPEPGMLDTAPANSGSYIVKDGDNFWEISKKVYGTHGLFLALYEFNRSKVPNADLLRPGTELSTPDISTLKPLAATIAATEQPKLARPRKAAESSTVSTTVRRATSSAKDSGLFFREAGLPVYRVGKSDTLRKIALDHLGRAERWEQIYNMNQELLKSEDDLRPGVELRLPADASRVALSDELTSRR